MPQRFYSKGKGASRRVIPITNYRYSKPLSTGTILEFSMVSVKDADADAKNAIMTFNKVQSHEEKRKVKMALVSAANKAKVQGHQDIAHIYSDAVGYMAFTKPITAEEVNRNQNAWYLTFSARNANNFAKEHKVKTIHKLPNGTYAIKKKKSK